MYTSLSSFDLVFTIEAVISAAIVTAILAFALSGTVAGRVRAVIVLAIWFAAVVVLGATGTLGNEHGLGTPALGLTVLLPIAALAVAFRTISAARVALSEIPLWILIAAHTLRVLGFAFLALYAAHRLPAPFAPVAGWGDILVGALAVPVAWLAARQGTRARWAMLSWNVVGTMDLIAAIGLGTISSPGPLQLLAQSPGSGLMTTLPWILIPCFLVPAFQALHIAIFYRLSGSLDKRVAANSDRPNSRSDALSPGAVYAARH
jgi:hypothetical protein